MAKKNSLLGVGGQRSKYSKSEMRGAAGAGRGPGVDDAQARKQELLRKLKEKSQGESTTKESGDGAES